MAGVSGLSSRLTLNSNAQASSSLLSAMSHSSGSSDNASRSVEVRGRSLSTRRWSAERTKGGVKTLISWVIAGLTIWVIGCEDWEDIFEEE